jgi:WD40 repeat protein
MDTIPRDTILILAASPLDQDRLSLDVEVREIQNGLQRSRKSFDLTQRWAVRPIDLRRALLDVRPTYVHFCGHGAGKEGIVLEGQWVTAEALAELFSLFSGRVKCIVLNACYSLVQAKALSRHIDYVIGMRQAIGDDAAIEFSIAFYDALGAGESVPAAFKFGCNAIRMARIPEYSTPRLLERNRAVSSKHEVQFYSGKRDWDGAPDASAVYDRDEAASTLKSWILDEACRLVLITGLGGVGKTDFVTCLGRGGNRSGDPGSILSSGIHGSFGCVIWRSLLNATPPAELFDDLLGVLQPNAPLTSASLHQRIQNLLRCFQEQRCLVILDNVEAILRSGDASMGYLDGYEAYGTFFEQIAKAAHQSCLLLTSREKPRAVAELEGKKKPVRSLSLTGVRPDGARKIFSDIGCFFGSDSDWQEIARCYGGNPLALELAALHIEQVFNGDLAAFLKNGRTVFADLNELLDWHLDRLTKAELDLVYWLAIERAPVDLAMLSKNLASLVSQEQAASTLQSLQRRIPLEKNIIGNFSLQPVLVERVTARLINQIVAAIEGAASDIFRQEANGISGPSISTLQGMNVFNDFALVKATAQESVGASQQRLILSPVLARLSAAYGPNVERLLLAVLRRWKHERPNEPGYAAANILHLLAHLGADLRRTDFSHLSVWEARLHDIELHSVDFSAAHFRNTRFRQAFGTVFAVAYARDGARIAVGDDNGEVRLFQASNGELQLRCVGHADTISFIAFSPNGTMLASASFDGTVRLWDLQDGRCIRVFIGHRSWIYCVAFSPDGRELITASEDGTCRVWDVATTASSIVEDTGRDFLAAVSFSHDGRFIAVGGSNCEVHLIDRTGTNPTITLKGHAARVRTLAFSPRGDLLASGAEDCQVNLWRISDGRLVETLLGHHAEITSLSLSGDGKVLAAAGQDGIVRLWCLDTHACLGELRVANSRVWSVSFHPTEPKLAAGSEDGTVRIWNVDSLSGLATWQGYSNKTWSIAYSSVPYLLVSGSEDHVVRVWDTRNASTARELRGHTSRIWAVACSPDGQWIASASDDRAVRLWRTDTGVSTSVMCGHTDWIRALAFSGDSSLLATAGEDAKVLVWDVRTGKCGAAISAEIARVLGVAFCGKHNILCAAGSDGYIYLYSWRGTPIGRLGAHQAWINALVVLDGGRLASCSDDCTVKFWDVDAQRNISSIDCGSKVTCGAYCAETGSFITGTEDGMMRRWNINNGECLASVRATLGPVRTISINATHDVVATSGDDGAIRLWQKADLLPTSSANVLRPVRPYDGLNISGASGLSASQMEALLALGAIAMPTP